MGKKGKKSTDLRPVRLRLELVDEYLSADQQRMLVRYGESTSGETIMRDILIPSDMMLHNLHYAIQRLFGWQNSHLRSFRLPDDLYNKLTGGTVRGWSELVGYLFQPPSEAECDLFWDDDYTSGSINAWLKKKYTGPYVYGGTVEALDVAQQDVKSLLEHLPMMDVRESFVDYMARAEKDKEAQIKIIRRAPLIDLTLSEMQASLMLEGGTESLLERLVVDEVLAAQDEPLGKDLFPVAKELIYNYDFGDDWVVKITKYKDSDDLINKNLVGVDELKEARDLVVTSHRPVCIHRDGLSVLDDVGGLGGFAEFLGLIYEGEDKKEIARARAWAKGMGWQVKKVSPKKMI